MEQRDKELLLETSAFESLDSGKCNLLTWLIKLDFCV